MKHIKVKSKKVRPITKDSPKGALVVQLDPCLGLSGKQLKKCQKENPT